MTPPLPKKIVVYTTQSCPFCHAAKNLLKDKGLPFEEVDVTNSPEMRDELVGRSGGRTTVPQVFVDGESIGGYQELAQWVESGQGA